MSLLRSISSCPTALLLGLVVLCCQSSSGLSDAISLWVSSIVGDVCIVCCWCRVNCYCKIRENPCQTLLLLFIHPVVNLYFMYHYQHTHYSLLHHNWSFLAEGPFGSVLFVLVGRCIVGGSIGSVLFGGGLSLLCWRSFGVLLLWILF